MGVPLVKQNSKHFADAKGLWQEITGQRKPASAAAKLTGRFSAHPARLVDGRGWRSRCFSISLLIFAQGTLAERPCSQRPVGPFLHACGMTCDL